MKRILIFSTTYLPDIGGAEIAVKEITNRIKDVKFDIIVARLKRNRPKHEKKENVNVYRVGIGLPFFDKLLLAFLGYKKGLQLHKKNKYDLVWSIMASFGGFAALKFKEKTGVKFLLTLQEGDPIDEILKKVRLVRGRFNRIFTKADRVQAISTYLAKWAKEMDAKCEVEVVPNGINNEQRTTNNEQKNEDIKRVITVSRLVEKNGLEDLIKAIKIVNKDCEETVVLKIIGDGTLRSKLEKLVKSLRLNDRFVIKGHKREEKIFEGSVSNKQVYEYLNQADVFVRPSLSEGLGNAFLEAMAMEVPVVATPVGGIPDFLEDGKTGWFCKVKDPKSIAEKIKYILDEKNREEVEKVIANAKEMVQEKYSWDLIANKMNKIFQTL